MMTSSNMAYWINDITRKFLSRGYLPEWKTVEDRINDIALEFANHRWIDKAHKFKQYMMKWYYSLSSPVWSNYWLDRGLPISCFWSYLEDSMDGILSTHWEVGMMSKYWGWTSWYFWDIRSRWSEITWNWVSSWAVHFMELFDKLTDVVSQGNVRRGKFTPYLPLEHGDINEFLDIWTEWHPIQNMTTWVTVGNERIKEMKEWDKEKRVIWAKLLQRRSEIGFPYIMFKDNANDWRPSIYKDLEMEVKASNLCCEIMLPSSRTESFVCCLSSMNLLHYNEWKDTDAVEILTEFLDTVIEEFINKTNNYSHPYMDKARNFAQRHRAIWVWVLGWHSFLQSNMIPFESKRAHDINEEIFKLIRFKTNKASRDMASELWAPELLRHYWRRNTTLMAVAPTTSSAFILWQVSQSIEPLMSNYYVKDLAKDKVTIKNKYLEVLLEYKWCNERSIWESIREKNGSVQHLKCLDEQEKAVFKTYSEINQYSIIDQAATRQKYIDQWQSLNVIVSPSTPVKEINALYLYAHEQGIKSLYYQHSVNAAKELSRFECSGCEA